MMMIENKHFNCMKMVSCIRERERRERERERERERGRQRETDGGREGRRESMCV